MKRYQVCCAECSGIYEDQWWLCPNCNGSLIIRYNSVEVKPQLPASLSLVDKLGEGQTPLIFLDSLSRQLGAHIWAKCEFQNPTGSFKDRGSVVEIAKALELNKAGVVCASTGNMAASLAAYAARNQLKCVVVVPATTPESKLQQAVAYGAYLETVDGTYDDCVAHAQGLAIKGNYFLCGDYVLRREGQKSLGWELTGKAFSDIVVPVGNGTVGIAVMQGLSEAEPSTMARFVGVQAITANPIAQAWQTKTTIKPQHSTLTIASAFNVGNPLDGNLTLQWLAKTAGTMTTVSDQEIIAAQQLLAQTEGLYVESAAASTVAALFKMRSQLSNKKIALILTGSGLKERR
ncbi:MAG TPA: threonine synthase [Vitreimonas sp.]|nr:threonine synthase [Vitreimonas sp.]